MVAPTPVSVAVTDGDVSVALAAAEQLVKHRGYDRRADRYGKGSFGAVQTCLIGMIGQVAFAKWIFSNLGIRLEIDTRYRRRGDGGIDFHVCGYGVQVKTAKTPYDELLLDTRGVEGHIPWDVCFRLQWYPFSPKASSPAAGVVEIRGFIWSEGFRSICGEPVPARGDGDWTNYEIRSTDFSPASMFIDKCRG